MFVCKKRRVPPRFPAAAPPPPPAPPLPPPPPPLPPPPPPPPRPAADPRRKWPASLSEGGNEKAWRRLADAVAEGGSVVLHGPVGCGKTHGLSVVLPHLGIVPVIVDPSFTLSDIRFSVLSTRTAVGAERRALVVEDAEGMGLVTESHMSLLVDHEREKKRGEVVLLVCNDAWAPQLKATRGWTHVRLFAPGEDACRKVGRRLFPSLSQRVIAARASECGGDLRRLRIACETGWPVERGDASLSLFQSVEMCLRGTLREADRDHTSSTHLLFQNYLSLPLCSLEQADVFSEADALPDEVGRHYVTGCFYGRLRNGERVPPLRLSFEKGKRAGVKADLDRPATAMASDL